MKLLADGTGKFIGMAEDGDSWVVPDGGAVHDTALTFAALAPADAAVAALGVPGEIAYDPATDTLTARARTLDPAEQADYDDDTQARQAVAALTAAIDGAAPTTVAQVWTLLRPLLRIVRALVRIQLRQR